MGSNYLRDHHRENLAGRRTLPITDDAAAATLAIEAIGENAFAIQLRIVRQR
jgi:hypothetical protein